MSLSNYIYQFEALDTTSTSGAGKTGLTYSDFTVKFCHPGGTLVSATTETITTLGTYQAPTSSSHIRIKELNATDPTKGIYEAHLHDSRVSQSNGSKLWIYMSAAGSKIQPMEIDLVDVKKVNVSQWSDQLVAAPSVSGYPRIDVSHTSGTSVANGILTKATNYEQIADTTLGRDFSLVTGESGRSLINAGRFIRNKWYLTNDTLIVTKEDDTTIAWSGLVQTGNGSGVGSLDPY